MKAKQDSKTYWGLWWHSRGADGHLVHGGCVPLLFRTRKEALAKRDEVFGYIRCRPDLRAAPYHWRLPKAVKVVVKVVNSKQ